MAEAKTKKSFYLGTGRRKTAVARIRMGEGSGKLVINGRQLTGAQPYNEIRDIIEDELKRK